MNKASRLISQTTRLALILIFVGAGLAPAHAQTPQAPADFEAQPASNSGVPPILLSWDVTLGATSYNVYRSTVSGEETLYGTSSTNSFTDSNVVKGPPTVYYYTVAAVNGFGTGPQSEEEATPTPLPLSPGNGLVAGVPVPGGSRYYCEDAALDNFDWFVALNGWFPQVLGSSAALSPNGRVVDMAYADEGMMTFYNVQVPTSGWYNIDFRYAYSGGLFGGVNNREMGLAINNVPITNNQQFPITGDFETYEDSILQEHLNAGTNTIQQFNTKSWGISRVDTLTVTTAAGPGPGQPGSLKAVAGNDQVSLSWTPSAGATAYQVYRGEGKSDSEAVTPVGTTAATTFTDTGLINGRTYFYNVSATNSIGISPDSDEVTAVPSVDAGPPSTPTGVAASSGDTVVTLTWTAVTNATSYKIFRGTTSHGESATAIATVSSPATSFANTGLTNGTAYFYEVAAVNAAGTSADSSEVSATPAAGALPHINCGGPAAGIFTADEDFAGGGTLDHANTIDLSAVTNPAPMAVYQTARDGNFSYAISGFVPGSSHTVRLHFAETYFSTAGSRTFNVAINGTQVLKAFDIFATAGAKNKANIQQFTEAADLSGNYLITFTSVVNNSMVSGIEIQ